MWIRHLTVCVCLISCCFSSQLLADSPSDSIELLLTQKPDNDCDGIPENTERVAPGSCLIYEIQAVNTDDKPHHNVLVSTRIPEHSILVHPYARINDSAPIDSFIKQRSNGIRLLRTRLESLEPGHENKIILHYSVRIL